MHDLEKLYKLMPIHGSALCGAPDYRTLARRVAAGAQKPEECILLKESIERINALLRDGVRIGTNGEFARDESEVLHIQPCTREGEKASGRINLTAKRTDEELKFGFIDSYVMCWSLSTSGIFENLKCFPDIGISRIEIEGKSILISKNGKIMVRRAESKEDVLKIAKNVARLLWPAMICSECGSSLLDCASGACGRCAKGSCKLLAMPPLSETTEPPEKITEEELKEFERIAVAFSNGEKAEEQLVQIEKKALSLLAEGKNSLPALALSRNFRTAIEGAAPESKYTAEAKALFIRSFSALKSRNAGIAEEARIKCGNLLSKIKSEFEKTREESLLGAADVAASAISIANLI